MSLPPHIARRYSEDGEVRESSEAPLKVDDIAIEAHVAMDTDSSDSAPSS